MGEGNANNFSIIDTASLGHLLAHNPRARVG
jgi:hypothetical protein